MAKAQERRVTVKGAVEGVDGRKGSEAADEMARGLAGHLRRQAQLHLLGWSKRRGRRVGFRLEVQE